MHLLNTPYFNNHPLILTLTFTPSNNNNNKTEESCQKTHYQSFACISFPATPIIQTICFSLHHLLLAQVLAFTDVRGSLSVLAIIQISSMWSKNTWALFMAVCHQQILFTFFFMVSVFEYHFSHFGEVFNHFPNKFHSILYLPNLT